MNAGIFHTAWCCAFILGKIDDIVLFARHRGEEHPRHGTLSFGFEGGFHHREGGIHFRRATFFQRRDRHVAYLNGIGIPHRLFAIMSAPAASSAERVPKLVALFACNATPFVRSAAPAYLF